MGRWGSVGSHRRYAALQTLTGVSAAIIASGLVTAPAEGVVVQNRASISPAPGWVGYWNGSSGVPIGPHWVITAKHTGGSVGMDFWMQGVAYNCVEIREHPTQDIQLLRVTQTLPGWHRLATGVEYGDPCILGGYGATAGADVTNGYDWSGPHQETWGANVIQSPGTLLAVRYDPPATGVPFESLFAVNDSGGGLFVYGADSQLELAGVAVSVTNFGSTVYGNVAYALNVEDLENWIMPIVDPGEPISSSVIAPRASLARDGLVPVIGGLGVLSVAFRFWRLRRRSRTAAAA